MSISRGVAIVTFNRGPNLGTIISAVKDTVPEGTKIIVVDDGSTDETPSVVQSHNVMFVQGPNKGVAFNKNRALFALQDCDFLAILEDDLMPVKAGWFEMYEKATLTTGIHHFCRVQNKTVKETVSNFTQDLKKDGITPIYGPSPRGDFTFISKLVLNKVGAFNKKFIGVGYAHGEWSERVVRAGLVPHPLKWVDLRGPDEFDYFTQIGDTEGGRWDSDNAEVEEQLKRNRKLRKQLANQKPYTYLPLVFS